MQNKTVDAKKKQDRSKKKKRLIQNKIQNTKKFVYETLQNNAMQNS